MSWQTEGPAEIRAYGYRRKPYGEQCVWESCLSTLSEERGADIILHHWIAQIEAEQQVRVGHVMSGGKAHASKSCDSPGEDDQKAAGQSQPIPNDACTPANPPAFMQIKSIAIGSSIERLDPAYGSRLSGHPFSIARAMPCHRA
jgi:hypothetical protein